MAKRTSFNDYQHKHDPVRLELSDDGVVLMQAPQGLRLETYVYLSKAFADLAGDLEIRAVLYSEYDDPTPTVGDTPESRDEIQPGEGSQLPQVEVGGQLVDLSSFLGMDERGWYVNQMLRNELEVDVPMVAAVKNWSPTMYEPIPFAVPLLMDVVVAADDAYFQDPHFARGFVPGDGMTLAMNVLVGPARARYFSLTGYKLTAQEAQQWGLVHEVLPEEKVLDRAWDLAHKIASRPSSVVRNTRQILTQDIRLAFQNSLRYNALAELWSSRQFFMGASRGRNVFAEQAEELFLADRLIDVVDTTVFDEDQKPAP